MSFAGGAGERQVHSWLDYYLYSTKVLLYWGEIIVVADSKIINPIISYKIHVENLICHILGSQERFRNVYVITRAPCYRINSKKSEKHSLVKLLTIRIHPINNYFRGHADKNNVPSSMSNNSSDRWPFALIVEGMLCPLSRPAHSRK